MGLVVVVAIISQKGKGRRCCKSKRASARTGIENLRERERINEIERRGNDDGEWTYPEGEGGVYSFIAPAGMAASNRGGVQSARRFLGLDSTLPLAAGRLLLLVDDVVSAGCRLTARGGGADINNFCL